MAEALLAVLGAALKLWGTKEGNKALDLELELRDLSQEYYDEKNKPDPNMALLDAIEHRIQLLGRTFVAAQAGGPAPSHPPG